MAVTTILVVVLGVVVVASVIESLISNLGNRRAKQ